MKYHYQYQAIRGSSDIGKNHYRVANEHDYRIAICFLEENAQLLVETLNKMDRLLKLFDRDHTELAVTTYRNALEEFVLAFDDALWRHAAGDTRAIESNLLATTRREAKRVLKG